MAVKGSRLDAETARYVKVSELTAQSHHGHRGRQEAAWPVTAALALLAALTA